MMLVALVLLQFSFLAGVRSQTPGAACGNSTCISSAVCDSDNTCKKAIGADCSTGASANCPLNAVCQGTAGTSNGTSCECTGSFKADGVFCKASPGRSCSATSGSTPAVLCVTGHTCESGTCKANKDTACNLAGNPVVNCITGLTCSLSNAQGTCKIPAGKVGGTCTAGNDTTCQDANANCPVAAVCTCKSPYIAGSDYTCVVPAGKVGGSCTAGNDATCTDTNSACTGTGSAAVCTCKAGFETKQSDLTCLVSTGADCSSPKSSLCKSTDICENNFCRIKQAGSCVNNTLNCVAGATCVTSGSVSTCTCKTELSTANAGSGKCDPKANKIGGTCTSTSCEDTNAECATGTCTCKTNYMTSPATLTCGLNVGADCSSNSNLCITGSFCQSGKCKRAAGQYCTGTGDAANCVSQSDCTNAKCTCQIGYTARDGLCSAAAGLFMSSLLTLLVGMTSRLI